MRKPKLTELHAHGSYGVSLIGMQNSSSYQSPSLAGYAMSNLWIGTPVMAAGLLKLAYDFIIYGSFRKIKPPEETTKTRWSTG